uniref:Secreted protein n=1 Tax=Parascaris univalens TaxID=6257 RepID=A0A914ZPK1_PARUN
MRPPQRIVERLFRVKRCLAIISITLTLAESISVRRRAALCDIRWTIVRLRELSIPGGANHGDKVVGLVGRYGARYCPTNRSTANVRSALRFSKRKKTTRNDCHLGGNGTVESEAWSEGLLCTFAHPTSEMPAG